MFSDIFVVAAFTAVVLASLIFATEVLRNRRRRAREAERVARMPRLYTCDNNGIVALVTAADYDLAVTEYWRGVESGRIKNSERGLAVLHITPRTMVFYSGSDDSRRPRTGNLEQFKQLTEGCRVEPRFFFVPFSSFLEGRDSWQYRTFRQFNFAEAKQLIHGASRQ